MPAVELVTVGTELLIGDTIDTNAARIGRALTALGIGVARRATVGDDRAAIGEVVGAALDRTGTVIVTGGLGPTRDDLTREAVSAELGVPLEFHEPTWEELVARWARVGRTIAESNRAQAMVPAGGEPLHNRRGSAPGLWIEHARGVVILMPGVPVEVDVLLEDHILPRLAARHGTTTTTSRRFRTTGVPESVLGELLGPLEEGMAPVTLAYLPDQVGVDLRLTAWGVDDAEATRLLDAAEATVRGAAGKWIYTDGTRDLAAVVLDALRRRGMMLAVAESCTGGLLGARLTAISGSSDAFAGGIISYANEVKVGQLGVDPALLEAHGAVSKEVALAMVEGVCARLRTGAGIAITGVAGPGGGTEAKPVGTVWAAWQVGGERDARLLQLVGDREQVRARATQAALAGLLARLRGS